MAGKGRPKSEDAIRDKDHKDKVPRTKVKASAELRGFDLPEGYEWHPRTIAWWDTWRRSALSSNFGGTDWDFLLETAVLHTALWMGNGSVASELRLRVAKFGATPEDRLRLRIDVESPDVKPDETESKSTTKPVKKSDRRERLTDLKIVPPLTA